MQITRETDYAIRCVLHLSKDPDRVIMVDSIARDKKIPKSFLAKILQKLTKAGIVKSFRGVNGGYKLDKHPSEVSLLNIIESIEGPVVMNECAMNKIICDMSDSCTVHPVWVKIRKVVEGALSNYNLETLSENNKK
jgi:Rrf2 family protein